MCACDLSKVSSRVFPHCCIQCIRLIQYALYPVEACVHCYQVDDLYSETVTNGVVPMTIW